MDWENILNHMCPKCGHVLENPMKAGGPTTGKDYKKKSRVIKCLTKDCDFGIRIEKYGELVNRLYDKERKQRGEYPSGDFRG